MMETQDFYDYAEKVRQLNLHPKQAGQLAVYAAAPFFCLNHLVFYGPPGIGKYSQVLRFIQGFSPSDLKYEKKLTVRDDNAKINGYVIKVSDIHYEVDMAHMGCLSKLIWHAVYGQIREVISTKAHKIGFIVCRNFHGIHSELLDIFYSYMQHRCQSSRVTIKFIFLSEAVSFFPDAMLHSCDIVAFQRPAKIAYTRILQKNSASASASASASVKKASVNQKVMSSQIVGNIQLSKLCAEISSGSDKINEATVEALAEATTECNLLQQPHRPICAILCEYLVTPPAIVCVRNALYDLFIYHLDLCECVWMLLGEAGALICKKKEMANSKKTKEVSSVLIAGFQFFELYNNNYRPIYHLELLFFNLVKIIHS